MTSGLQILISLVVPLLLIYYFYNKNHKVRKYLSRFPAPPAVPFFGNVLDFKTTKSFLDNLHKYTKEYGSMVHMRMGPLRHVLVASDYKFLEFLLSSNQLLTKTRNFKFLEPWLGTGLVTADGGPKWKSHRRLITPAFHFKILEQFIDIFEAGGNNLVEKMKDESEKSSVDIFPHVVQCTFNVICETAMGTRVDSQAEKFSEYFNAVKHMCRLFIHRGMSMLLRYDFIFQFTKDYAIQNQAVETLHGYTNRVINAKRQELSNKKPQKEEDDDLGLKKKKVFLDLILEASVNSQPLEHEEIREEVDTFMFAGTDTTATAATFVLYCLANNKEVQEKAYKEQQELFGNDKNPKITYSVLHEMKYLENVIKESLRLYPPVPAFGRLIDQDVYHDGEMIPAGIHVIIFVRGIHMNPEFYPNPEKFDPSRFENIDGKAPFAFIPFSAGPRNCIGQKYAILELKSLVSKIVRNFELSPASPHHEPDLVAETVLKSRNGMKIGISLR